jgi:hypothetical protein
VAAPCLAEGADKGVAVIRAHAPRNRVRSGLGGCLDAAKVCGGVAESSGLAGPVDSSQAMKSGLACRFMAGCADVLVKDTDLVG